MTTSGNLKVGRPELPNGTKRSVIAQFRCTREEKEILDLAAKGNDQSLSDWLRDTAIRNAQFTGKDLEGDERSLFFRELGQGLSYWHWLEAHLFHIFSLFLYPANIEMVSNTFFSVLSFEGRLRILRNTGKEFWQGDAQKITRWNKCLNKLSNRSKFRNRLAHDIAIYDSKKHEYILHFGGYNRVLVNQSRQPLRLKEIQDFNKMINEDTVKLASIAVELAEQIKPLE